MTGWPAMPIRTFPPGPEMPSPRPPADRAAGPEAVAARRLDRLAGDLPALGIALSGGGDSMALLHLAAPWARARGLRLEVVTVDHRLRPEAAEEARLAARTAQGLGLPAQILTWRNHPPTGNLMQAARHARHALIADWARARDIPAIALGHTRDDLAETLLMRLARGAGLEGLAAMAETWEAGGIRWLRPLLDCGRAELRDWLATRALPWIDDPTNDDPAHERARIRAAMTALGLEPAQLARSARNLAQARDALIPAALALIEDAQAEGGALALPLAPLLAAPGELRRRVLVAALAWITGSGHPPRQSGLDNAWTAIRAGQRRTLAGTLLTPRRTRLHLTREPAAAARAAPLPGAGIWDRRFAIPDLPAGLHVAAGPGSAAPWLWQGGMAHGPAPSTPLRDIATLRRMISAPRLTDS